MISNNKSIVPGILIKVRGGLDSYEYHPEDRFYILTEIKTIDGYDHEYDHEYDMLIFYGLTEERFFSVYRWHIEESIKNEATNTVA